MRLQEEWHAAAFPNSGAAAVDRAAVWFSQIEDPTRIMTTARWESVEAHWDWIRSGSNTRTMAALEEHIIPQDTILFHVGHPGMDWNGIFGRISGLAQRGLLQPLDSPVISVERMSVKRGNKAALDAKLGKALGVLQEYARPHLVQSAWRQDLEDGAEEEFVIVCGWESVQQHLAFADGPQFSKYSEIQPLISGADLKHYRHLSVE
jgi:heme-degrading monooxygenase HmoA